MLSLSLISVLTNAANIIKQIKIIFVHSKNNRSFRINVNVDYFDSIQIYYVKLRDESGLFTSGRQWALPPPHLMVCPPPSCIALIFVCPSIIAQVQLGQIKGVDGWILFWR